MSRLQESVKGKVLAMLEVSRHFDGTLQVELHGDRVRLAHYPRRSKSTVAPDGGVALVGVQCVDGVGVPGCGDGMRRSLLALAAAEAGRAQARPDRGGRIAAAAASLRGLCFGPFKSSGVRTA